VVIVAEEEEDCNDVSRRRRWWRRGHHLPALIYGLFCGNKNYSRHERIPQGLHRNW